MNKVVTIIGSRETPSEELNLLREISQLAVQNGYIIRTGDASGADKAARDGCNNKEHLEAYKADDVIPQSDDVKKWLMSRVRQFHPAPERLKSNFVRNLMMRNIFQIFSIEGVKNIVSNRTLAKDTINSDFITDMVFCYTKGGKLIGGTAFAIRIANYIGIPVYNIGNKITKENIIDLIKKEGNTKNIMKCFPKIIKKDDNLLYSFDISGIDEEEYEKMTFVIPNSKNNILFKGGNIKNPTIVNMSDDVIPKIESKKIETPEIG